jgi:hypothetical protein
MMERSYIRNHPVVTVVVTVALVVTLVCVEVAVSVTVDVTVEVTVSVAVTVAVAPAAVTVVVAVTVALSVLDVQGFVKAHGRGPMDKLAIISSMRADAALPFSSKAQHSSVAMHSANVLEFSHKLPEFT